ncbi:MAG TPA: hypothetical protein VJL29_06905 [Thermoguttaceae bacterium]|nr:hypothetical protein [Thermoguttaceae bacterium]
MAGDKKQEIVTFKVDQSLWEALRDVPNRSEFIRQAIQTAMDRACPLCQGTGTLSPEQQEHWKRFSERHHVQRCDDCRAIHLVCVTEADSPGKRHRKRG